MKNLFTIFKFELSNFIESKSYIISTAVIAIIIAIVMFLPNFVDLGLSDLTDTDDTSVTEEEEDDDEQTDEEAVIDSSFIFYDESGQFLSADELNETQEETGILWEEANSVEDLKKAVKAEDYDAGYVIKSDTKYDFYVNNKDMFDVSYYIIEEIMSTNYQLHYCEENNLDYNEILEIINAPIESEEHILGKDAQDSYWYCYALVIIVFMLVILYGTLIATAVTNEKSNRSIEVLVTSTNTNSLLFGKVLAGTVASFLQIAIILGVAIGGYKINADVWGNALDMLLDIKSDVLVAFALFGITGFIFYAFVYGAMGALVSKTEDINKSAGGIQMVIMIVYFLVLFQMSNIDGIIMKVLSFLPISSYSAMFIRVAMGEVAIWEIIISYIILVVSTVLMGILGAKIYRMGTLRYGNPIKITTALKSLKNKD